MPNKASERHHRGPYRVAAWSQIIVGPVVVALWSWLLLAGRLPGWDTERGRWLTQLLAQGLMAVWLFVSGVMALTHASGGRTLSLPALGMMVLSAVHYAGYFIQDGQWVWTVAMGAVVLLGCWGVTAMRTSIRRSSASG